MAKGQVIDVVKSFSEAIQFNKQLLTNQESFIIILYYNILYYIILYYIILYYIILYYIILYFTVGYVILTCVIN